MAYETKGILLKGKTEKVEGEHELRLKGMIFFSVVLSFYL